MLQIVLLAGKFVFLIVLYLFIYRVIRSIMRELRVAAPAAGKREWSAQAKEYPAGGQPAAAATASTERGSGVWTLVVQKSPSLSAGEAYAFPVGAHALAGRSPEMDIYLEDTFVSSKHALFEATAAGLQVEDLRSTNGTQVNGADVSDATVLRVGDRVEVGDTVFQVEVR
jgi:hypothetical protein